MESSLFEETKKNISELLSKTPEKLSNKEIEIEQENTSQNSQKEEEKINDNDLIKTSSIESEEIKNIIEPFTKIGNNLNDARYAFRMSLAGIPNKNEFINNQYENEEKNIDMLDKNEFNISNIYSEYIDSGYKALSLQIFGNVDNYKYIKKAIFTFLENNKENIRKYYFERSGKLVNGEEYYESIKDGNSPIGDLELSSFAYLINADIYLFELKEDQEIYLLNGYKGLEDKTGADKDKIFLNLCLVKSHIFQVIYEKNRRKGYFCNKDELIRNILKNIKRQENLDLKFEYVRDGRKATYSQIEKYVTNKDINDEGPLPEFIVKTTNESKQKFRIKDFKVMVSKYFVDKEINRLKLSFNTSNNAKMKKMKTFLIPYQLEKINMMKKIHDLFVHEGEYKRSMDKIIKEYSFWWYNIHSEITNYARICPDCQKIRNKINNP